MDEFELIFEEYLQELVIRFESAVMSRQAALDGILSVLQSQGVDIGSLLGGASTILSGEVTSLANLIISQIVGSTRQVAQLGVETFQRQNHGEGQKYLWQTESGNPCPDCVGRSGYEAMPMDEWELIGLPRQGATICNANCMCVLVRV